MRWFSSQLGLGSVWLTLLVVPAQTPIAQAERLIQAGQLASAEQILRQELTGNRDPVALYLLGFVQIQNFQFEEAETLLREAVSKAPGNADWQLALAKALLEQGRNRAAIEVLDRALAIRQDPGFYFARAMCQLNTGQLETAERDLRLVLRQQPRDAEANFKLGELLFNRGDYKRGLAYLEQALQQNPAHLEARFLSGLSHHRLGHAAEARAAFEAVLGQIPGHAGALYNLGRTLLRLGEKEAGRQLLERFQAASQSEDQIEFQRQFVKRNPTSVDKRLELARLLLETGHNAEAVEHLTAAQRLSPGTAEIYRLLAVGFRRLGRLQDAQRAEQFAARVATPR